MHAESQRQRVLEYLYGELDAAQAAAFERDLVKQPDLRQLLEEEQRFDAAFPVGAGAEVANTLLTESRVLLRAHLRQERSGPGWLTVLAEAMRQLAPRLAWAGGAAALLLVGIGVGRSLPHSPEGATTAPDGRVVDLRVTAYDPSSYQVALEVVTVSTQTLDGRISDAAVQHALAGALLGGASAGGRLDALELLQQAAAATEIESALIHALLHDPNPGVRVEAATALARMAESSVVRTAMREALAVDPNDGVRVTAIDVLRDYRDPATIKLFRKRISRDQHPYLRTIARQALDSWDGATASQEL
jgi:HEAT repeat protein